MRRRLYWVGVLAGVLLLAGGVVVGALAYTATESPAAVVRGYFAALARSDAPRALAYGMVPFGPHTLLTSSILREQQRIAPLHDVSVVHTARHGSHATVDVNYDLAFAGTDVPVSAHVPMHKSSGRWRLDYVALPMEVVPGGAQQRESVLGGAVPTGTTMLFPGALPIRFDTPYLRLDPYKDNVTFNDASSVAVYVETTDSARAAMTQAVRSALQRCVTGSPDPMCPLPNERYVPGSIRGVIAGSLRGSDIVVESLEPVGTLRFTGSATIAGRWQRLNFHNVRVTGRGRVELDIHAVAYATRPLRLRWVAT
jgi:hypothetical protein